MLKFLTLNYTRYLQTRPRPQPLGLVYPPATDQASLRASTRVRESVNGTLSILIYVGRDVVFSEEALLSL